MKSTQRAIRLLLVAFALVSYLCACGSAFADAVTGTGYVDEAHYLTQARQLAISGWAAPEKPNVFTTNLIVWLGDNEVYRGRMERSERPDVVAATGRADWLSSGFSIRVAVPSQIAPGVQALRARMRLGDGSEFDLAIAPAARSIRIDGPVPAPSLLARLCFWAALIAPVLALTDSRRLRQLRWGTIEGATIRKALFGASVVFAFVMLVAAGWTGSSLGLVLDNRGIAKHDEIPWLGEPRAIRSDEWQVITPLAISQAMHQPQFPILNRNLGPEGQNMMVIGMTGVPVAHISSFARPATWGFFLFDQRRALAWYWWFPFFSCFAAVWLLLLRFFSFDWRLAAGMALTISCSPYSVVFSGWPAYVIFFPVIGLLATDVMLRTVRWERAVAGGLVLGLAIAGFALILYPAWQISVGYLFLCFALAWFASCRKELYFGRSQAAGFTVAMSLAALLLLSWWSGASGAIASIRETLYPGQRSVEVGGDIDPWFLIKGMMSPISMYQNSSLVWGASDAGSIALFLLPAMAAVALRFIFTGRIYAVAAVLCGYIVFALLFMFAGFPSALAKWTLWASTTSYRFDLALAMAQLLLFAWLASAGDPTNVGRRASRLVACAIAGLFAVHGAYLYQLVPPAVLEPIPPSFILLSLLAMAGGSYLLLRDRHGPFFLVYGALMLVAAVPFNPLGVSPSQISATQELADAFVAAERKGRPDARGIIVVGERNWAMVLPAVGMPVVNSVFYYPQQSFWRRLDPDGKSRTLYNRYQRVLFVLAPVETSGSYRIDSPRLDEVRVTVDPVRFDFRVTGGQAVLAGPGDARILAHNASLQATQVSPGWTLFEVMR